MVCEKPLPFIPENLKVRPERRFSQGGHGRSAETTMADAHVPAAEVDDIAYQRHKDLFRTFLDRPEVCTCGALPNPLAALCCADVDAAAGVRARHMRAAALGGAPVVSAWACWRTLRARPCPCAAHFSARRLPAKPAPCPISHPPTSALAPTSPPRPRRRASPQIVVVDRVRSMRIGSERSRMVLRRTRRCASRST